MRIRANVQTLLVLTALAPSLFACPGGTNGEYAPVDLGDLSTSPLSYGVGLSDAGALVGQWMGASYGPYIWQDGVATSLGSPLGFSQAKAVNTQGDVVGYMSAEPGGYHACLWKDGEVVDLDTLGNPMSYATAINDLRQVAGYFFDAGYTPHAFLWQNGELASLGLAAPSQATGINESGQIVGWFTTAEGTRHAFLWSVAGWTDLGAFEGTSSEATAINDDGVVVGHYVKNGVTQAFRWQNGTSVELPPLANGPSKALAVNNAGEIVGTSAIADGSIHPVLWKDGQVVDLATAAGANAVPAAINNRSEIAGTVNEKAFLLRRGVDQDTTAPVTDAALDGPQGWDGWYTGPVSIRMSATDPGCDQAVVKTYVQVDSANAVEYTAPVVVAAEGSHTVSYWSVDDANNYEAVRTLEFKVDSTVPSVEWSAPSPAPNVAGWNNTPVTIGYTITDTLSGVFGQDTGSFTFSQDGAGQTGLAGVTDKAGNQASVASPVVNIDTTAPILSAAASESTLWPPNGRLVPVQITGSAIDLTSGIAGGKVSYMVKDSEGLVQPAGLADVSSEGQFSFVVTLPALKGTCCHVRTYTITVQAVDAADNKASLNVEIVVPNSQGS